VAPVEQAPRALGAEVADPSIVVVEPTLFKLKTVTGTPNSTTRLMLSASGGASVKRTSSPAVEAP
jgi:hypothetical protein